MTATDVITTRVEGRTVVIVEVAPGIFNAFDGASGERLAIAALMPGGWWLGCRIGATRRELHVPEGCDAEAAVRHLLAP